MRVSVEGECLWGSEKSEVSFTKETLRPPDTRDGPRAKSTQSGSTLDTADRREGASRRIPWRSQGLMKAFSER